MNDEKGNFPVFEEARAELTSFSAGDFKDERTRTVWEYWLRLKAGRNFPGRSQFDPIDVRHALGNIVLVDVQGEPPRFRFRLIGSKITRRDGVDMTGRWVDEVRAEEYRSVILSRLQGIAADPRPLLVHTRAFLDDRWRDYEALWLPFAEDGRKVDLMLCCQIYAGDP